MQQKIEHSIKILRFAKKFANMQGFQLILSYSGGKDSDVLLDIAKKAGISYDIVFKNTTVEHPITCKYIRSKDDNIIWDNPKRNFFEVCKHKKGLPTIFRRFCCSDLKERKLNKSVLLFGIRKYESVNRAKYWNEFSDKKKKAYPFSQFDKLFEEKCRSKSVYFNPIFDFTDADIWAYIEQNNMLINPIYQSQNRCGCWLCPFASVRQKMRVIRERPALLMPLVRTCQYLIENEAPITRYISGVQNIIEWFIAQDRIKDFSTNRRCDMFNIRTDLQDIVGMYL